MAFELTPVLAPAVDALMAAVILDLVIGDPNYAAHPVRLIGQTLTDFEKGLRRVGLDGYGGGIVLFVTLALVWVGGWSAIVIVARAIHPWLAWAVHVLLVYSLLALGDLLAHGRRIEGALRQGALAEARRRVAELVGRDTAVMDAAACRRAAVESLSENLTDGFTSPLFWYVVAGLPGLVLFKVVSTMDSMVGYKMPRYLQFGWCGARLDDLLNYIPARLTWLLIAAVAVVLPRCSGAKALRVGLRQHAILPGPNSGWSEAATAGAIARRLVGPIWMNGTMVTDVWIGDAGDPALETADDYDTASRLVAATGVAAAALCAIVLMMRV